MRAAAGPPPAAWLDAAALARKSARLAAGKAGVYCRCANGRGPTVYIGCDPVRDREVCCGRGAGRALTRRLAFFRSPLLAPSCILRTRIFEALVTFRHAPFRESAAARLLADLHGRRRPALCRQRRHWPLAGVRAGLARGAFAQKAGEEC
jgi:hypothetical protein